MTRLDAADTPRGHRFKYRFTSSKGCLLKESGWTRPGTYYPGPFACLTIEAQSGNGPADSLESVDNAVRAWDARNRAPGAVTTVWKSKKIEVIHGRSFAVVESFGAGVHSAEPHTTSSRPLPRWPREASTGTSPSSLNASNPIAGV